jgi:hypothetical protein
MGVKFAAEPSVFSDNFVELALSLPKNLSISISEFKREIEQ